jgi:hypothetical protein
MVQLSGGRGRAGSPSTSSSPARRGVTQDGAPELLGEPARRRVPPMDDPPPGYVLRIAVERVSGNGEWE